ncbi:mechanosensitive ion channel domain-containing protein [Pseudomonadota bacterium]
MHPVSNFLKKHPMCQRFIQCFLLLLLFVGAGESAIAQSPATAPESTTLEGLSAKKAAIEAGTSQDEKVKARLIELYEQAIQARTQTEKMRAEHANLKSRIKSAPGRLAKLRKQLAKKPRPYEPLKKLPKKASIDEVSTLLRQEEERFEILNASHKKYADELTYLLDAASKRSNVVAELTSKLESINTDLNAPSASEELPVLITARREALLARKDLRTAELELYHLQMDNPELLTSLTAAERDLAARESNHLLPGLEALREAAQKLREASAAKAMKQAERDQREAIDLPEPIRIIAEMNVALSTELQELTRSEAQVVGQLDTAHRSLDEIKFEADSARQRVEVVGSSEAIGRMLRKRAAALPSLGSYRRNTSGRRTEIDRVTDRQIDIDELRRDLLDVDGRVQNIVSAIVQPVEEELFTVQTEFQVREKNRLSEETRQLLMAQRESLMELHKIYGRYIGQLAALDVAERQLVAEAEQFIVFIEERLMWIPSTKPLAFSDAVSFISGSIWLVSPGGWAHAATDLFSSLWQGPVRSVLVLLAVMALLLSRAYCVRQMGEIAKSTRKIQTNSFWLTLQTLWLTLVLAVRWPALMLFIAWRLAALPTANPFSMVIAEGLYAAGSIMATIAFFRHTCRTDGMGDRHFRWPKEIRLALLSNLGWLQALLPTLVFIIAAVIESAQEAYVQGLGRPAFLVMMAALLVFAMRILQPTGPVQTYMRDKSLNRRLGEARLIWVPIAVLVPLSMMLASMLGYHYTALVMERHVQSMVWFFLGLMLLKGLLLRSLYLAEMKFRYEEALKKREELRAQREKEALLEDEEKPQPTIEPPEIECAEVDYEHLSEQAKRLLHTGLFLGAALGLWVIWADMLPIFSVLDTVTLPFTTTEMIDGIEKSVPVTLTDLILALLFIAITIIAAKNLPGLMEIIFLQRLPLDPGARYAIKALTQYVIVAIGIITAFNTIGAEWSSIQWLIAALSVGLGFGLQEIVANFISGIILLFERPIRVGDTVTVGETTGKVSRIRIRATTILNFDKQELLVPNKEFITGRLLNWTLTDQMIRIVVPVGIAYGSDVDKALDLMAKAAAENEHVLKDPEPVLTFEEFGDNALVLNLRCYLGSLEYRWETRTALFKAINEKFNAAGIVIAFPQRDLHLDTTKPLDIRLHQASVVNGVISPG